MSQKYAIKPLVTSLNGAVFSPAYFKGKLVVCSDQKDRLKQTILDGGGNELVDLYLIDPENPASHQKFDERFRTDFSDGPITFNLAGDFCVISRNIIVTEKARHFEETANNLALYYSAATDGGWSEVIALPFNSIEYNCTHPALDAAGKRLVFASNMPGGKGGYDLWETRFEEGKWTAPENLGDAINTKGNEVFPSISGDIIYFSSAREAIGGLDIYAFDLTQNLTAPALLDTPINSAKDDFGLISLDGLDQGYLSSNRSGRDELWEFEFEFPELNGCDSLVENVFCFTLYEENAMDLGGVESLIYRWKIDTVVRDGFSVDYCFPGPGGYEINLDVIDTIVHKTYFNHAHYYIELDYEQQPYISCADTVKPRQYVAFSAEQTNLPSMEIEQYFWDFGDGKKGKGMEVQHQFEKPGTFHVVLGVIGSDGEQKVEECVFKAVVCAENGQISAAVLTNLFPAQSEDSIIVKDKNVYDEKASEDGVDVQFGVEAFVGEELLSADDEKLAVLAPYNYRIDSTGQEFKYVVGAWREVAEAYETWTELIEKGFADAVVAPLDPTLNVASPGVLQFILHSLQFDSNTWSIRASSFEDLDKLVEHLHTNPEDNIRIDAYTDAYGSAERNLILSKNRAKSVKDYLITKGIVDARITAVGIGAENPIASNETAEGRQQNRRVEIMLSK